MRNEFVGAAVRTFAHLMDTFGQDYVAKRRADDKLRSTSLD